MPDSPTDRPTRALALARGFMSSRILITAHEIGLFGYLSRDQRSAAEVAEALGTDPRTTETLLDALAGLEILDRSREGYSLRDPEGSGLLSGSPGFLGDELAHLARLWGPWSDLTRVLREGRAASREPTPEERMDLARAMRRQAREAAPRIAALLDDPRMETALDLGGGSGAYAIALAERLPQLRVVLYDADDQALRLAAADIEQAGLQDRIEMRQGDFLIDEIGRGYDLVLLASVLCTLSEEEVLPLLEKIGRSLRQGGRIVVRDHLLDRSRTSPPSAAVFAVSMLVTTAGGRVHSSAELQGWLAELGFEKIHRVPMPPMALVIAEKPGSAGSP